MSMHPIYITMSVLHTWEDDLGPTSGVAVDDCSARLPLRKFRKFFPNSVCHIHEEMRSIMMTFQ